MNNNIDPETFCKRYTSQTFSKRMNNIQQRISDLKNKQEPKSNFRLSTWFLTSDMSIDTGLAISDKLCSEIEEALEIIKDNKSDSVTCQGIESRLQSIESTLLTRESEFGIAPPETHTPSSNNLEDRNTCKQVFPYYVNGKIYNDNNRDCFNNYPSIINSLVTLEAQLKERTNGFSFTGDAVFSGDLKMADLPTQIKVCEERIFQISSAFGLDEIFIYKEWGRCWVLKKRLCYIVDAVKVANFK